MDLSNTGKVIAKLRRSAGFTQASLAEKLGISDKAISKWERGITFPDTSILNQLCILLDTDIESIMYGHEQSKHWIGVLILNEIIHPDTIVYNKPLIHYLISQFLLVGITDIIVVGNCKPIFLEGVKISIVTELNQQFTQNAFVIYGNQFIYGPNLTKHFMRAMSRTEITVIAAVKAKGNFGLFVDSEKRALLSDEPSNNKYYALPYVFYNHIKIKDSFDEALKFQINVETMVRGMIHFDLNTYEKVYEMAGFIKMMEKNTGEKVADIEDIVKRRITNVN